MTETISSSFSLWLAFCVLGIPLLSALICFIISDKVAWLAPLFSSLLIMTSTIIAIILFFQITKTGTFSYSWPWISISQKTIHAGILLDSKIMIMVLVVNLVSLVVHLFSISYMAEDNALVRYFGMLGFFTFAMIGLVMSSNLLVLFCFWELVGFSSYRLIGHWHEKPEAVNAATKAFIINRVGDLGFLIGLMILWSYSSNLDITELTPNYIPSGWLTAAGACIFIGVISKSAQFPLFNWLPDAMEGPTPVSALIHAATMVAAGVYVLIRIENLFTTEVFVVISIVGVITAIAGAMGALFQYDIKKILAYSTISQLGYMVMAVGSGAAEGGYLHLLHHAFFKAGLFLAAGAIIHAMYQSYHHHEVKIDVQDIRNLGGLRKKLPITFLSFIICGAALAGIPFTSGFVSKELILTQMAQWSGIAFSWKWFILIGAWMVSFVTPIYIFRMIWFLFLKDAKHQLEIIEVPLIMRIPMLVLSLCSLALFVTFAPFHISSMINFLLATFPAMNLSITILSTLMVVISLISAYFIYSKNDLHHAREFLFPHFYLDWIYDQTLIIANVWAEFVHKIDRKVIDKLIHGITYFQVTVAHLVGWTDRFLVDGLVNGVAYSAKGIGTITRSLANGKIQSYLLWTLAGLLIFILWVLS